jgi:hypothetical protein
MTLKSLILTAGVCLLLSLTGCGRDKVRDDCSEPKPYQSIVASKRVVSPEGLDSLDEFREMPIPKSETPPRPEGARCIESPPSVLSGS